MLNILSHGVSSVVTAAGEQAKYPPDGDIVALILVLAVLAVFAVYMLIRNRRSQTPDAPAAEPVQIAQADAPKAPGAAGQLKLYNVEPKTAAMVMAIVADKTGKPLNELRFLSIKEVE